MLLEYAVQLMCVPLRLSIEASMCKVLLGIRRNALKRLSECVLKAWLVAMQPLLLLMPLKNTRKVYFPLTFLLQIHVGNTSFCVLADPLPWMRFGLRLFCLAIFLRLVKPVVVVNRFWSSVETCFASRSLQIWMVTFHSERLRQTKIAVLLALRAVA